MSEVDESEELEYQTLKSLSMDQIHQLEWPRCKVCRRYTFGHDKGRGQNCRMTILSQEELDEHDKNIMELRKKKKDEMDGLQQKEVNNATTNGVGEVSSDQTAEPQGPPGTSDNANIDDFRKQLMTALQNISNVGSQASHNSNHFNSSEVSQTRNVPIGTGPNTTQTSSRPPSHSSSVSTGTSQNQFQQPYQNYDNFQNSQQHQFQYSQQFQPQQQPFHSFQTPQPQSQPFQPQAQQYQSYQHQQPPFQAWQYQNNIPMNQFQMMTQMMMPVLPVPEFNLELSYEAWKNCVKTWTSQVIMPPSRQLMMLIESLKNNKERPDLKQWVITSIIEDVEFDKSSNNCIFNLFEKMDKKFSKSTWKMAGEIWKEVLDFKVKEGEDPKKYLERWNILQTRLKNAKCVISPIMLAHHFLNGANLNNLTKQNIQASVDLDDGEKVLDKIKNKFEKLVNNFDSVNNATTFFAEDRSRRSQSEMRTPRKEDRNHRRSSSWKGRPFTRSGRKRTFSRPRGSSRPREREYSQERRYSNNDSRTSGSIHNTYTCEKFELPHPDIVGQEDSNTVFMTGTENSAVVDCGCPKTVGGKLWISLHKQRAISCGIAVDFKTRKESQSFKFGPSKEYRSYQATLLPIQINGEILWFWASSVAANVPLLLGKDVLKEWKCQQNFVDSTMFIGALNFNLKLSESPSGHYTIDPIDSINNASKITHNNFFAKTRDEKKKTIEKVHKITAHKLEDSLRRFFHEMNAMDQETKELITEVVKECPTCRKYAKTRDFPKVGLRKASDINEVVSLDLKEMRNRGKYILFMVCEYSKYIRGEVINNKEPETIIKAIEKNWIHKGPGYPSRGFFSDKGKEFDNQIMKEYASRLGLTLRTTPAYSPWANGSNERNHFSVDRAVEKVLETDPKLSLQEATDLACFWQNQEIRKRFGCSPQQLLTGKGSSIPGISDGNVVSDQLCSLSKTTQDIFARHSSIREAFRQADNSERLKRMLRTRIPDYVHRFYKTGDQVLVKKRNENGWEGPYTVKHHGGKEVIVIIDNNERSVSSNRVIPLTEDDSVNTTETTTIDVDKEPTEEEPPNDLDESQETITSNANSNTEKATNEPKGDDNTNNDAADAMNNDDEVTSTPSDDDPDSYESEASHEPRPKRWKKIEYVSIYDDNIKQGIVHSVGKASGKSRFRCVIKNDEGQLENLDFQSEVIKWKYIPKEVSFDATEPTTNNEWKEKEKTMEERGVTHMFYMATTPKEIDVESYLHNINNTIHVMATEIPKSKQNTPEVNDAKDKELSNWYKFGAIEEVEDINQRRITGRWVVTLKQDHDGMKSKIKARWCMRGFQEEERPRSDSPTVSKESIKLLLSVAANEGWSLTNLDVTNAFLQGEPIKRELFAEPPVEVKRPGIIWKIKRPAYGLYDAGRNWFLAVEKTLTDLGCTKVTGDDALFMYHNESGLQGLACIHVDDFSLAGNAVFKEKILNKLLEKFTFGKVEEHTFRFTGLDIKEKEGTIVIDQDQYCNSLEEMKIVDNKEKERELTKEEYMKFRGITGKLNWLQECTRPDLSFDSLTMSMKTKRATLPDVNKLNKIIRKAKASKSTIQFRKINSDHEKLYILSYGDASYRTIDEKTRSIEGRVLFLTDGVRASPLLWKSRKISQVCHSSKEAETRSIDKTTDDSIFMARMLKEIFTGKKSMNQIPVVIMTDSNPLKESLYSTKQVERKTIRHVVQSMKDSLARKEVDRYEWVDTHGMVADLLTKDSANPDLFMEVLESGRLPTLNRGGED